MIYAIAFNVDEFLSSAGFSCGASFHLCGDEKDASHDEECNGGAFAIEVFPEGDSHEDADQITASEH